uniref:F-box domain-containing protein n=1 Tax=Glossina pallidipes TaxID=7398 RepID=A0A1B0AAV0_GLOPL
MANIDKGDVCEKTDSENQPSSSHARALENPSVNEKDVTSAEHDNNATPPQLIDIWEKIFSYLPYADLLQVNAVCKDWREIAARCFKRKSKLVISDDNFKEMNELVGQKGAKYKNVKIAFQWKNDIVDAMILINTFRHIGPGIVYLDVCDLLTLSRLYGLLPNVEEIVLSGTKIPKGMQVDFNQYSKLKSVVVRSPGPCPMPLSSNSNQLLTIRLEKLSINMEKYSNDYINVLATHAPSLRWLRLIYGRAQIERTYPQLEDTLLQETFRNFTELTILDLRYVYPEQVVKGILENLSEDNHLNTIGLKERVETGLLELTLRKWSNSLQCIDYICYKDTDTPVKIAQYATDKFRSLWLTGPGDGYEWTIQDFQSAIPKANHKITELYMVACPRGQLFCDLVQRLPNLTNLHFLPKSKISYEEMGYIFRHLISLQQLTLPVCESQADMEYLSSEPNVSNLKSLQMLWSCLCPIKVLEILNLNFQFKELRELHVRFCQNSKNLSSLKLVDISQYFPALQMCFTYGLDLGNTNVDEMRSCFPRLRTTEVRNAFR